MVQSLERMPMASTTASSNAPWGGRARGFTLIELMVTVAIVAILAAVAYPSYTNYITRSNRSAAQGFMFEVSNLQQRYLLDARAYAADLAKLNMTVPPTVSPHYTIETAPEGTTPPGFTVTATPIPGGSQAARDTACGKLTLHAAGLKEAAGGGAKCW